MRELALCGVLGLFLVARIAAAQPVPAPEAPPGFRLLTTHSPSGRALTFHFAPRDSAVAVALAEIASRFAPVPAAGTDLRPDTFFVVVAPSEADFRQLTGGRAPDWGLAIAFPALRRVVVRSPRLTGGSGEDPATVLRHELGHLYLDAAAGGSARVPRWFNEGFAALYADEWRWVSPMRLAWGRLTGALVPLRRLDEAFPETPPPELAYIQSMAAVRALRERGGDRGMRLLLERLRAGATFDAALRETYGFSLAEFYARWEQELGGEYGWAVALTDERGLWVFLALVVAAAYFMRRRGIKRAIDRLRRREDAAARGPEDHSSGVENEERYREPEDDGWQEEDRGATF